MALLAQEAPGPSPEQEGGKTKRICEVCEQIPSFKPAGRSRGEEWSQLGQEPWDALCTGLGIPQDFLHVPGFPLFLPAAFGFLPSHLSSCFLRGHFSPLLSLFTSVSPALAAAPTGNCVLSFPFCLGVSLGLCLGLFPGEVSEKPQRILGRRWMLSLPNTCDLSPELFQGGKAITGREGHRIPHSRIPAWQQQ